MTTTKTVLVTGATRGIGLAFAKLYKTKGWNVIGAARNLSKAQQLEALEPHKVIQLDSTDEVSVAKAASQLKDEPIDLLINNAGIFHAETTKSTMMEQFEVNAVGPFLVTQALLPILRAAASTNGLAIVAQVSTGLGSIADVANSGVGWTGYRTSKAALNMINATFAHDLKKDQIAAIVLCPGNVSTDMNQWGSISAEESVSGLVTVLDGVTLADTGRYRNYSGDVLTW